jgi:folate-binding protein YgfZ
MGNAEQSEDGVDIRRALEVTFSSALVVPAPELATFVVTGGDRQTWLNGLVTCDLAPLKVGDAAYGLFVEKKGRVVADAIVVLEAARLLLIVPRRVAGDLRTTLEHHLIMEDAEIDEGAFEVELVHGPRAQEVLAAVRAVGASGGELDRTGLGGAVIVFPAQSLAPLRGARDASLAAIGGMLGDDRAWEALRLDRRVPQFGADFDATNYPQEAGLEKRAVSFSKGCYLGQEVVFMLEKRGHVKRLLVTLRVASDLPPPRGASVLDANREEVGTVTSAAIVPTAGGPVAMAMVKRAKTEPGLELEVLGARATVLGPAA